MSTAVQSPAHQHVPGTTQQHTRKQQIGAPSSSDGTAPAYDSTDFNLYYKNGIPKEVIVISDDEDEELPTLRQGPGSGSMGGGVCNGSRGHGQATVMNANTTSNTSHVHHLQQQHFFSNGVNGTRFDDSLRYSSSVGSKRNRQSSGSDDDSLSEVSLLECVPSTVSTASRVAAATNQQPQLQQQHHHPPPLQQHQHVGQQQHLDYTSNQNNYYNNYYLTHGQAHGYQPGIVCSASTTTTTTTKAVATGSSSGVPQQSAINIGAISLGSGAGGSNTMTTTATSLATSSSTTSKTRKRRKRASPRLYIPPSKPIQKVRDVYVPTIKEKVRPSKNVYDDADGHYMVSVGTVLAERFHVNKILGQGTFGKVVAAYDRDLKTNCAIKIIRSVQKYRDASRIELRVLQTLSLYDKHNVHNCIRLKECFDFRNHICIVTDLLGISIYDFIKSNMFMPFPGSHIQSFAKQLLRSVAFLHELGLVHTDLKPENILLESSECTIRPYKTSSSSSRSGSGSSTSSSATGRTLTPSTNTNGSSKNAKSRKILNNTKIHLIDFGSATFNDEYHSSVVSTRHYRAPEIILGVGWSYPCDVWSIGCILVELCTGEALFQTHDNMEHLALMQKVLNKRIDPSLVEKVRWTQSFVDPTTKVLKYPSRDTDEQSIKYVNSVRPFDTMLRAMPAFRSHQRFWLLLIDLLNRIFEYDPSKRITAREALLHPWFDESIADDGM